MPGKHFSGEGNFLKKFKERESRESSGASDTSSGGFAGAIAHISAKALVSNYRTIQELVPEQAILPMLKANAYGHGAVWAARQLLEMPGLYGIGVATLEEARTLRKELGDGGKRAKIIVFAGTTPWSDEKGEFCEKYGITPVIATEMDWGAFFKGGWTDRVSYELKFNTGLNRLGIWPNFAPNIVRALKGKSAVHHPAGVFSHLAMSEEPDSKLSLSQKERFSALKRELASVFPSTHFHLGNSGAIWNAKNWGLKGLTDVVRPGLSLYGIPPWKGAPMRGLEPVLSFHAQVIHRMRLKPGESIGYGATYRVTGTQPVQVAILAAGYADGVSRSLSSHEKSQSFVMLGGRRGRFLGRVSMDLCAVECGEGTQVGEWAEFFGNEIDPWVQAEAAGTIPYELLTSLSSRVQRIYG